MAWVPGGKGLTPALPVPDDRPLGQLLSRQLLLQVPVFWRPHWTGVGRYEGGPRPSVLLRLGWLLLHLYLVAVARGKMMT